MMLKMIYKSHIAIQVRDTSDEMYSDLRQVSRFLLLLRDPPPIKLNIVESGVKHHRPNNQLSVQMFS